MLDIQNQNASLLMQDYEARLEIGSYLNTVWGSLAGIFEPNKKKLSSLPVLTKVNLSNGVWKKQLGWRKPLSGAGIGGTTDMESNEEDPVLRSMTVYGNDYAAAVSQYMYGSRGHTQEGYGVNEQNVEMLTKWHAEKFDLKCHEATLQVVDTELTLAPVSLIQKWNPNWIIKSITRAEHPAYSTTLSTFASNIATSLGQVHTDVDGTWDQPFFVQIYNHARNVLKLKPYANGRYAVLCPADQWVGNQDLTRADSVKNLERSTFSQTYADAAWEFYAGSVGMIDVFIDDRAPILKVAGSTLTAYYKKMGDTDDRTSASGTLFDIGSIHGEGSLIFAEYEALHMEENSKNYDQRVGIGAFRGAGCQLRQYDAESGSQTASTLVNQYSAVIAAYRYASIDY